MKTLRYGDTGEDVKVLQSLLQAQGFFNGYVGGNFKTKTRAAVHYFQQTHIGKDGEFLKVDGIVGPNTWWALYNPAGAAQRNNIKGDIISGLSDSREKLLVTAIGEHKKGVAEDPDGANWGDGVTKYLTGIGPAPWCNFYVSWCYHETFGEWPQGKRHGHCMTFWNEAKKLGNAKTKDKYKPVPGDIFIMLYKNSSGRYTGSGHTGIVLSRLGDTFNTVEGNAGNRVKVGKRYMSQSTLVGFINLFGNDSPNFEQKLFTAESVDSSFSGTR